MTVYWLYAAEDEQHIIDTFANEEECVETAELLGVKRITAWGIVRRYQLHGHVNWPRGGARNRKVDQEMIATVEEHPELYSPSNQHRLPRNTCKQAKNNGFHNLEMLANQLIVVKKETILQDRNRPDGNIELGYSVWSIG